MIFTQNTVVILLLALLCLTPQPVAAEETFRDLFIGTVAVDDKEQLKLVLESLPVNSCAANRLGQE